MSKYNIILDVYENQSISKAAAKHNYTQSAVSQTIRNYEKEIGLNYLSVPKRNGTTTGTEPIFTELKICVPAMNVSGQIAANINNLNSGLYASYTIQVLLFYHWSPGVLKNFSSEYSSITFQLYVDSFQQLTENPQKRTGLYFCFTIRSQRSSMPSYRNR